MAAQQVVVFVMEMAQQDARDNDEPAAIATSACVLFTVIVGGKCRYASPT
jgi:hypothetical protein